MKKLFAILTVALGAISSAHASGGLTLDTFPTSKAQDLAALQDGAKTFVNYCLSCHSASAVRYNRLQELGLTPELIKANLMLASDKIGDQMTIAMRPADAKAYFGATPPDLSLTARARSSADGTGADWIYTYLRSFYRDASRPTGWNNVIFPNVGMPHALWNEQGGRLLTVEQIHQIKDDKAGTSKWVKTLTSYDEFGLATVANEDAAEHHEATHYAWKDVDAERAKAYDDKVANLVAYMGWMADPVKGVRHRLGVIVLIFLAGFTVLAWGLNRSYWKDVK